VSDAVINYRSKQVRSREARRSLIRSEYRSDENEVTAGNHRLRDPASEIYI